jgi:hypothetical protein
MSAGFSTFTRRDVADRFSFQMQGSLSMNSFFLWAALGLVPFAALDGNQTAGCPKCDCCGCCETETCGCDKCACSCCVDECPTEGAKAEREGCCGSGCCGK